MTLKALYSLTGTILLFGICAIQYSIYSSSLFMFLEGIMLLWLGVSLTFHVWEQERLDI